MTCVTTTSWTGHGSAACLGVYLIPLQIGAPTIAAPRAALFGYWLYVGGALALIFSAAVSGGASNGW